MAETKTQHLQEATTGRSVATQNGRRTLLDQSLFFWLRLILGGIFIVASVDKIQNPAAFAEIIFNYQILPGAAINLAAIVMPWLELLLGCLLLLGFWLHGAVLLAGLLILSFFSALMFNLARGLNVHCGCFSTSTAGDPATTWYIVRDSLFLVLAGSVFYDVFIRSRTRSDNKP
ncbi:MAG: DoxX family membrane protein [Syntrophobacteraceae bacterium]|nr:DoxX family membrane protein [Syntrophobacteraceae bacterium]